MAPRRRRERLGSSLIVGGVPAVMLAWAAPVKAERKVGNDTHTVDELVTSSDIAWLSSQTSAGPDHLKYPERGFPEPTDAGKRGAQVMAVSVIGGFETSVAKPEKADKPADGQPPKPPIVEHSPPRT